MNTLDWQKDKKISNTLNLSFKLQNKTLFLWYRIQNHWLNFSQLKAAIFISKTRQIALFGACFRVRLLKVKWSLSEVNASITSMFLSNSFGLFLKINANFIICSTFIRAFCCTIRHFWHKMKCLRGKNKSEFKSKTFLSLLLLLIFLWNDEFET